MLREDMALVAQMIKEAGVGSVPKQVKAKDYTNEIADFKKEVGERVTALGLKVDKFINAATAEAAKEKAATKPTINPVKITKAKK